MGRRYQSDSAREMSGQLARTRRDFLRTAAGMALGSALVPSSAFAEAGAALGKRKVIVVTFGGGARDQETFAPEGQENIPHLIRELIPQSTFFTQVVNRGILGHYVATASLATGVYETINNFASLPPEHPTVFEYFRKDLKRPSSDAWVVEPRRALRLHRAPLDAPARAQPALDHHARHRHRACRGVLAVHRRHSPHGPVVCGDVEGHPERAGICGQHHTVHPAGFWARLG